MNKSAKNQIVTPSWAVRAKALMKAKRITQQQLADSLGMERGAVSHYLNGRRDPGVYTVAEIAAILGVYTSQLLGEIPLTPESEDTRRILQLWTGIGQAYRHSLLKMMEAGTELVALQPPDNQ